MWYKLKDVVPVFVVGSPLINAAIMAGAFADHEKAMANAIKFLDHPKAKQLDPRQTFNNSYVDEALK